MKKMISLLIGLMMIASCACAQETQGMAKQHAQNLLTEVYGYTVQEADGFEMKVVDNNDLWNVEFWPKDHPEWVYTARFNKENGALDTATTPFKGGKAFSGYPGEATMRDGLRLGREKGWFVRWNEQDRQEMAQWFAQQNRLTPAPELQVGLAKGNISAGNALHAYFVSCYGEPAGWTEALRKWHDEEIASYGLVWETDAKPYEGILRYTVQESGETAAQPREIAVVQFSGEIPEEIGSILAHPKLEGCTALCGAFYDRMTGTEWHSESGMIIFEKQDQRLLVQLGRKADEEQWQVVPVGEKSIRPSGEVYISCDPLNAVFNIVYPVSDTVDECFRLGVGYSGEKEAMSCTLRAYSRTDRLTGEGIHVEMGYGGLYATTTSETGKSQQIFLEKAMHSDFSRIDVEEFPITLEAWKNLSDLRPPKGYGVSSGVHLRAQTSSRSKDLGTYHSGTLVEILGEEDGDPYNWYRVRIGSMEGYMCSVYVDYEGSVCAMQPLVRHEALPVAQTMKETSLKSGTGLFAKTVRKLPAGTMMHVLAERGEWLHVMIPQGEIGWMMDADGVDGYVRAREVRQGASAMQLEWMQ